MYYTLLSGTCWTTKENAARIFSGTRVDVGLSFLTRVAKIPTIPEELKTELAYVRSQLSIINRSASYLLHYGAGAVDEDRFLMVNERAAYSPAARRSYELSPRTLRDMTEDLLKITGHLIYIAFWQRPEHPGAEG